MALNRYAPFSTLNSSLQRELPSSGASWFGTKIELNPMEPHRISIAIEKILSDSGATT
jgi:hypothetical protein